MSAQSAQYYDRAAVIPGRSCTRSKAPGKMFDVGKGPLYAATGYKSLLVDADGRQYLDMLCGLGAISLGYRMHETAGGVYSLPHVSEVRAAEMMLEHVAPWANQIRFAKTGSEATHAAYRIAKRATGRPYVFALKGAYHGWHEWCDEETRTYSQGHVNGVESFVEERGASRVDLSWLVSADGCIYRNLAAVFIEPPRWSSMTAEQLQAVRKFCDDSGALLVFDSMIYGGRFALGGTSAYFGVTPDLECYDKAIGNGASVACIVGRDVLRDHGEVMSGTYAGDSSGLQAVLLTLGHYLNEPVIETLWERGRRLAAGLEHAIDVSGWAGRVHREGAAVHQRMRFEGDDVSNPVRGKDFAARMAARGILWHPACVNVMFSHTSAHMDRVSEAAAAILKEMA